jgi:hypothetical protein
MADVVVDGADPQPPLRTSDSVIPTAATLGLMNTTRGVAFLSPQARESAPPMWAGDSGLKFSGLEGFQVVGRARSDHYGCDETWGNRCADDARRLCAES